MNINLHIKRLVLEGLPIGGADGALVEATLRAELMQLFGRNDAASGSLKSEALRSVQGAPLRLSGTDTPPQLGAAIAQSVHGAILK